MAAPNMPRKCWPSRTKALAAGDIGTAAQAYGHRAAGFSRPAQGRWLGLAACYLRSGDAERAKATLQLVRPDGANDESIRAVEAELKLKAHQAPRGETEVLQAKLAADANDHQSRFDLALALDAGGEREAAINELLELVRRDRKWNEDAARQQLPDPVRGHGSHRSAHPGRKARLSGLLFS